MSLTDVLEFAKMRIPLEVAEDQRQLAIEISKIQREFAARGMTNSGNIVVVTQEACAKAARDRIRQAWNVLHRGVTTAGISYEEGLEELLLAEVASHFPEDMNDLRGRVMECARRTGLKNLMSRIPDEIGDARHAALAEVESEIKLFAIALRNPMTKANYSPNFNITNSTVGAIQTGNQAIANVKVESGVPVTDLIKALEVVAQTLAGIGEIPGHNKAEIIELVAEGKHELEKEVPNKTKLSAYLPIISDTLKIASDLKPAYDSLKAAAKAFGIDLP